MDGLESRRIESLAHSSPFGKLCSKSVKLNPLPSSDLTSSEMAV